MRAAPRGLLLAPSYQSLLEHHCRSVRRLVLQEISDAGSTETDTRPRHGQTPSESVTIAPGTGAPVPSSTTVPSILPTGS